MMVKSLPSQRENSSSAHAIASTPKASEEDSLSASSIVPAWDTVSAARLMTKAPAGTVRASLPVRQAAGERFDWAELPPVSVKGKAEPLKVFALNGARDVGRSPHRRHALPLIGRAAEVEAIAAALDDALSGRGRVVGMSVLTGPIHPSPRRSIACLRGPAPRRMQIEGRTVRLGGFATGDWYSVRLSDAWQRERVDILVIAPETDPAIAERAFRLASKADNPLRGVDILRRAIDLRDPDPAMRS